MKHDLDTLKSEIQEHLESTDFVVFHSHSRITEPVPMVQWDCDRYPDYKPFLEAAGQLEVKMIAFHHRELSAEFIDDVMDQIESIEMPHDEFRSTERRLGELRAHEGFTCLVELSFTHEGCIYIYSRRAEWYEELLDIADEVDDMVADEDSDEEPDDSMGGYFSKN